MENVQELFYYEFLGIATWVYAAAFGAIFVGFLGKKIVSLILNRFAKLAEKTSFAFDDVLFKALTRPAEWAVMVGGLYVALLILPIPDEPVDIRRFVNAVISGATVALVVWFAVRLVDGLSDIWAEKAAQTETKLDDQLVPIVRRSAKVFFFVIGAVLVLQNMGYSVGSLLAGLGIGGVALAMASKDTVANLFGSLVIFLDKPFQIGDWIEMDEVEGTVEEVGLRTTRVRTFANSLVTVPNLLFTTKTINNWSQMKKRRIKMTVGVTYDTSPEKVDTLVKDIREIIAKDDKIRNDFYLVNFDNFGPSSLDIFIYCFTVTTNWAEFLQAKQEFMLEIMTAVETLGLSFAFPTQSLHVESLPEGAPKALANQRPR
jgi:MscS family membrane protein